MSQPVVFVDTETISLKRDYRHVWEIGLLEEDGTEHVWQVKSLPLGEADPKSLEIGKFYERYDRNKAQYSSDIAAEIEQLTRHRHIVGAVPNFEDVRLVPFLQQNHQCPAWHYHIIDIEALVVGYLRAQGETVDLPWDSNILSRAIGVYPERFDRHTALGDCHWTKAQWDVVMGTGEKVVSGLRVIKDSLS